MLYKNIQYYLAYNLVDMTYGTYLADDIVTHNTCFMPGTQINLADNTYKKIEEVEIGDMVKVFDEENIKVEDAPVNMIDTPVLDKWNVSWYMWDDIDPPWTEYLLDPEFPNGDNGWYVSPVNITITAFDNDTALENVTTYYKLNGDTTQVYDPLDKPVFSSDRADNHVEFWSKDSALNEEIPHNFVDGIKIDTSSPYIDIIKPVSTVDPGEVKINGTVTEYVSGSGVDNIVVKVDDVVVYDSSVDGFLVSFECIFTAEVGKTYDIMVIASDKAGNIGQNGG